jgi:hypothetical protein
MKAKWSGPVRPALEIVADVQKLLGAIIGEFTVGLSRQVDYTNLAVSEGFHEFQVATTELQKLELTTLSFNIKIAFFINLYNALVMHGFLVLGPPSTLHQVRPRANSRPNNYLSYTARRSGAIGRGAWDWAIGSTSLCKKRQVERAHSPFFVMTPFRGHRSAPLTQPQVTWSARTGGGFDRSASSSTTTRATTWAGTTTA